MNSEGQHAPRLVGALSMESGASLLAESAGHAQKLAGIGRFANVIAHDFNNLLTVIRAYADMALRERTLDATLREQLEAIRSAANSAAWLSQQLLAHSRRNTGRASALDLNLMIRDVHQLLGRSLPAGITAELRLQEDLSPIFADPGPVGQVLLSAVAQVMGGLPAGGQLLIESFDDTRALRLTPSPMGTTPHDQVTVRVAGSTTGAVASAADAYGTPPRPRTTAPALVESGPLDGHGVSLAAAADIVRSLQGAMRVTGDAHTGWVIDIALPGVNVQPVPAERSVTTTGHLPWGEGNCT